MDTGEKTEEPTAKRREKFRSEGKVATSRDVSGVALLGALCGLAVFGASALGRTVEGMWIGIADVAASAAHEDAITVISAALRHAGRGMAWVLGTVGAIAVAVSLGIGFAQTGGNWTLEAVGFKWDRLQLWDGLKRSLLSLQALQQIGLALAKASLLALALWAVVAGSLDEVVGLARVPLESGLLFLGRLLGRVVIASLVVSAVLAAVDLWLSRRRLQEQMKMTKQEVKDEFKQQEGDPHVRGRMRHRMREIGRNRMLAATREADVVVVNPTHYAVALTYKVGQSGPPKLVAKGRDAVAARIREIARRHQVPIVANPPVARAVFAACKVGQDVPPELYEKVARVIAFLIKLGQRRAAA